MSVTYGQACAGRCVLRGIVGELVADGGGQDGPFGTAGRPVSAFDMCRFTFRFVLFGMLLSAIMQYCCDDNAFGRNRNILSGSNILLFPTAQQMVGIRQFLCRDAACRSVCWCRMLIVWRACRLVCWQSGHCSMLVCTGWSWLGCQRVGRMLERAVAAEEPKKD